MFSPRANLIAWASIALGLLLVCGAGVIAYADINSSYYNDVNVEIDQPVPFSHEHHVGGLGIDCRYCHASVEESASAGMPASETCMGCHSKLWTRADLLEPIRSSWRKGTPVRWRRVNVLPDFVYFNHAIHISKGIGCAGTALAIGIATAKAILIALFFMHLKSASRLVRLFAVAGLFWWGVLLGLTMGDFVHRS